MKKKLLALAVLGSLAAPVFAQSNVQIYGVADAYMRYGQLMGDDLMSVHDGGIAGSRLGFRGEEDLGHCGRLHRRQPFFRSRRRRGTPGARHRDQALPAPELLPA